MSIYEKGTLSMTQSNRANLLTPKQAAEYLQIKVQTLAMWRTQGKRPRFNKLGRQIPTRRFAGLRRLSSAMFTEQLERFPECR